MQKQSPLLRFSMFSPLFHDELCSALRFVYFADHGPQASLQESCSMLTGEGCRTPKSQLQSCTLASTTALHQHGTGNSTVLTSHSYFQSEIFELYHRNLIQFNGKPTILSVPFHCSHFTVLNENWSSTI